MRRLTIVCCFIVVVAPGALAAPPGAAHAKVTRREAPASLAASVEERLNDWDLPGARAAVEKLLAAEPDSRASKALLGRVRFEEGDYGGAVAALEEAGDAEEAGPFLELVRATLDETKTYVSRESEHFVFRFRPGRDEVLAPYALATLEKIRAALATDLGWEPPQKVRVEVLDDAKALSRVSTLTLSEIKTSGTIAICKFDKLMITSPKALLRGYGWLDTLAHEYVHLVVSQKSENTVPIWLHEGFAKFLESRWRGPAGKALSPISAAMLNRAVKANKLIPFAKMHPSMAKLPSQEDAALAFAEVFTAVEYLYQKGGVALINALIAALKEGDAPEQAVSKATGAPFERFMSDWTAYLKKREYPKEALPASEEKLAFREDDARAKARDKKKDGDAEWEYGDFGEIEEPDARKWAHLGELMRERKRLGAAAEEFQKAYAKAGDRYPVLSNKYALVLMSVGKHGDAEQVLTRSLRPHPGFPLTHLNLARLYLSQKQPDAAQSELDEVIALNPFDPEAHLSLMKVYKEKGDEAGYKQEVRAMAILSGATAGARGPARLELKSRPLARVYLDDKDTGRTTPAELEMAPGHHRVRLESAEGGRRRELEVDLGAGEEKVLEVEFGAPIE